MKENTTEQELIKQGFQKKDIDRLQRLRLMDDDFMSKCFEDDIECTELVINIILDRDDLRVESVHTQHEIKNLQGRSVTLDIYAKDSAGKPYDIEIQRADRGAGAKRARYHSSVIDANSLNVRENYDILPETYVIFITENDIMKKGLPIYHIDRVIRETGEYFGDESHIIYVNGKYQDNSPLGYLMKDFSCTDPSDMHYKQLRERVQYFKGTKEGVTTMCKIFEDMQKEAAEKAAKEATRETAMEMAKKLILLEHWSCEKVSQYTNLTLEEIQKLKETLDA